MVISEYLGIIYRIKIHLVEQHAKFATSEALFPNTWELSTELLQLGISEFLGIIYRLEILDFDVISGSYTTFPRQYPLRDSNKLVLFYVRWKELPLHAKHIFTRTFHSIEFTYETSR